MVAHISPVVTQYGERVRRIQKVPRISYGRPMVRADGGPNRLFFCNLFNVYAMAIEFLKEIGLLRRTMQCESFGRDMTTARKTTNSILHTTFSRRGTRHKAYHLS
jgi:hypothetical protein